MAQMTPFELFGLKPAFKVDLEALHAAHERAILQVHPDRFADRPAAERRVAEQWASRINEAYAVLKDPVMRAVWLCEAAGRSVGAETNTRMPMDFLSRWPGGKPWMMLAAMMRRTRFAMKREALPTKCSKRSAVRSTKRMTGTRPLISPAD